MKYADLYKPTKDRIADIHGSLRPGREVWIRTKAGPVHKLTVHSVDRINDQIIFTEPIPSDVAEGDLIEY